MPRRVVDESRLQAAANGQPPAWSPDRKLLRILGTIPDTQVRCRSGHHKWASEEQESPRDPLPRQVVAHRREGRYLIEDPCVRCDAVKHTLTGEGGDLYTARSWIIYPLDWVAIPQEYPRGTGVLKTEWNRRTKRPYRELFREADREAREVEREEARAARAAVREVPFSSAGAGLCLPAMSSRSWMTRTG